MAAKITLTATAAHLAEIAHAAGDKASENALNKAIYHLQTGITPIATTGGYLVPSGTRTNVIHRVSETHGCSCEAAQAGRQCWHAAAVKIIASVERPLPSYVDALAAMDELFA